MSKRTLEVYDCDKCGEPGQRYEVRFPSEGEGSPQPVLILDRCERHNKKLESLRDEEGEWKEPRKIRQGYRKMDLAALERELEQAQRDHENHDDGLPHQT